jgi:hypothetical protein
VLEVIVDEATGLSGRVGHICGEVLAVVAFLACLPGLWRWRREREESPQFGDAVALLLALTVVVVPMYAPYNQVLLLPAILLLARNRTRLGVRSRPLRFGIVAGGLLFGWQWIASLWLTVIYLLGFRDKALGDWRWPFFATFAVPVCVFVLIFFDVRDLQMRDQAD